MRLRRRPDPPRPTNGNSGEIRPLARRRRQRATIPPPGESWRIQCRSLRTYAHYRAIKIGSTPIVKTRQAQWNQWNQATYRSNPDNTRCSLTIRSRTRPALPGNKRSIREAKLDARHNAPAHCRQSTPILSDNDDGTDGARGRIRTGTASRPADFTYPLQLSLQRRKRRFGVWTIPLPYAQRARRQGPSSLYTFPISAPRRQPGLARDCHQHNLLRVPRI